MFPQKYKIKRLFFLIIFLYNYVNYIIYVAKFINSLEE